MKTKHIIFTISLLVTGAAQTTAQQLVADTPSPPGLTVNTENLTCFKSLQCIKKENLFATINLDIFKNGNGRYDVYTLQGSAENEEFFAEYDLHGSMIRSTVIQRNIPLPREIRIQLNNEDLNYWSMVGNERQIKNFEARSIEYKVILQKDDITRTIYFDHKGENKNRLT
jgi:hypothetical protein